MKNKFTASEETEDSQSDINFLVSGVDIENRIIDIRSGINEQVASVIIRALMVMASRNSKAPINILLSCEGGNIYDGLSVYDYLMACPCPIHIQGSGLIASMGFIIYLAGDVRTATPNTSFMMHSISIIGDNTSRIVKHAEVDVLEAKRFNSVLQSIMAERTNRNKKYWYRTVNLQDKYFTVEEALEIGIMTKPKGKKNGRK